MASWDLRQSWHVSLHSTQVSAEAEVQSSPSIQTVKFISEARHENTLNQLNRQAAETDYTAMIYCTTTNIWISFDIVYDNS